MSENQATIDITDHIAAANDEERGATIFQPLDRYFLTAAFASLTVSVGLWFLVDQAAGLFVGLWVPSILALWTGVRICLLHTATTSN